MRSVEFACIFLLLTVSAPTTGTAQERVRIAERPACARCRIVLTPAVRIGDEEGDGIIEHMQSRGAVTRDGTVLVIGSYSTSIKVFDRGGRFLRTLGREGDGPGEFRGISAVRIGHGDSVHVFDYMSSRHSVFSPQLSFVRSTPLPSLPSLEVVPAGPGAWIFNATSRAPERIGWPLHLVRADGGIQRSFGSETGVHRRGIPFFTDRALAPAGHDRVWSSYRSQYVIDLYEVSTGRLIKQLIREADWFPSRMHPTPSPPPPLRPDPLVHAIQPDSAGLLWVMIAVPDTRWRTTVRPPSVQHPHGGVEDEQVFWDTRIEVLDPSKGTLVASIVVPTHIRYLLAPGVVGTVLLDQDGHPRLHTWQMRLVSP